MANTTKVKVSDFVRSSRTYAKAALKKANADQSPMLTQREARRLPKDLRDNFASLGKTSVKTKNFVDGFVKKVSVEANRADVNRDGFLTLGEGRKLPALIRDNFRNYVAATRDVFGPGAGNVKDGTSPAVLLAHQTAYGDAVVPYKDAFERAIAAVMTDEESETPRHLLQLFADPPMTKAELDAELKRVFKGLKLLPVGETSESAGTAGEDWIFEVDAEVGTDHGFWVSVNRTTGDAFVNGFN